MNRLTVIEMSRQSEDQIQDQWDGQSLSDLVDGRLDAASAGRLLRACDEDALQTWRTYHLIGDVLRSDDLAAACVHDESLLARVRVAMVEEPRPAQTEAAPAVQLLPVAPAANDGVFRWKMVAGLASFAAVAVLGWNVMGGMGAQTGAGGQLAQGSAASPAGAMMAMGTPAAIQVASAASAPDAEVVEPMMLRDARLDELLAAHRHAAGASALSNASGFLRNATFEGSGR